MPARQELRSLTLPARLAIFLLAAVLAPASCPAADDETAAADERLVKDAGISPDAAGLLAYFRERTLTAADVKRLETLVRQLGDERFEAREAAAKELVGRGAAAAPLLRQARRDPDAEIARRAALCLEQIEAGPGPTLPMAAARLVARRRPPGTAEALLGFLPFADDTLVEDEVLHALVAVSRPAAEEKLWREALADARPAVRAAAAHVVGARGTAEQRAAVRSLLRDKDAQVRYRAAEGLLAARDREAVPALIGLLEEAPAAVALQAEGLLYHLAGEQAPRVSVLDTGTGARRKCREAWTAWWAGPGAAVDLARAADRERFLGLTLGIEYNSGRVWECGPDGKVRWEFTHLQGPMEAQVLPGGRVLLAESNNHTVSERDLRGNIVWQRTLDGDPTGCQRLPNGNTFVSTFTSVRELTRDGKDVYNFKLPGGSNAIRMGRNGHILCAIDRAIVELDVAGRKVRSIPLPAPPSYVGIEDLPGDRFLLANGGNGQVLEVDAAGKVLWKATVAGACGVCRVPSGNTLVATDHRVVELDRTGKVVWEKETPGYARRVHRR
jgi:hypothetical protein